MLNMWMLRVVGFAPVSYISRGCVRAETLKPQDQPYVSSSGLPILQFTRCWLDFFVWLVRCRVTHDRYHCWSWFGPKTHPSFSGPQLKNYDPVSPRLTTMKLSTTAPIMSFILVIFLASHGSHESERTWNHGRSPGFNCWSSTHVPTRICSNDRRTHVPTTHFSVKRIWVLQFCVVL